ncbi:MAG: cell envelope integrity protein CreD [Verrucomicrobiae bacterium]|nr:cell envelope integrity protein CreD [Verrucomicrobiae bacterium]
MADPSSSSRMASASAGSFAGRHSAALKLAGIALLVLLLLIPLGKIGAVLAERLARREAAVSEIVGAWGREQAILGPVLAVPYRQRDKVRREIAVGGKIEWREVEETRVHTAFFLPAALVVEGKVHPERLHRGIYEAVVYRAALAVSGRFDKPDFAALKIEPEDLLLSDATVALGISDLRGAGETLRFVWGKEEVPFVPGSRLQGWTSGLHARVGRRGLENGAAFRFALELRGSGALQFVPVGKQNEVKIASEWPDPSFRGAFAPAERKVTPQGFEAIWKIPYYGRNFPQQWTDTDPAGFEGGAVKGALFGVRFLPKLDAYRSVERAMKYGVLVFALVFVAFFIFETRAGLRVHAVQYLLVGAALCLFDLLLLAFTEFVRFGLAYLLAAGASTLLIAAYCAAVFRGARRARGIAAILALTYGWLYVALTLQDWALIFGSLGLFFALAAVMFLTRRMEGFAGETRSRVVPPAPKGLRPAAKTVDV